jgi:hypothetical protein
LEIAAVRVPRQVLQDLWGAAESGLTVHSVRLKGRFQIRGNDNVPLWPEDANAPLKNKWSVSINNGGSAYRSDNREQHITGCRLQSLLES